MRPILVTGANKGIGLALAGEILRRHADTFVWLDRAAPRADARRSRGSSPRTVDRYRSPGSEPYTGD
jgi:NAD(P)-dependent dehydrogenase (short-subunit alcohol dehydrogenase family)